MKPRARITTAACIICSTTKNVERHHIGGRNHLVWVTAPLCRSHHRQFHLLLENAGVNLAYTPDPVERLIRALKAISILEWMVQDTVHQAILQQTES
jgi:hypothetical protein